MGGSSETTIDRQKMMEEMLKDHYGEVSAKERKRKRESEKKSLDSFQSSPKVAEFHFENMQGSKCSLQGSYYQQEPYFVTEVFHPLKPAKGEPRTTCHFFIHESFVAQYPSMNSWTDVHIPFENTSENVYICAFPSPKSASTERFVKVKWAIDFHTAQESVDKKEIFILAKSRFKLIQNMQGGPRKVDTKFCMFLDKSKLAKIYNDNKPEPIDDYFIPKIELSVFQCPFQNCNFVSDRKFIGIRSHLLYHFGDQIRKGAKPRAMLTDREKIACMSKTACSVENLESRGELVHHYGIFHCLVDDYFQEHVMDWFSKKYKHHFEHNLCPYDDIRCDNEEGLIDHLVLNHYYNLILAEVENMVMFKLTYSEEEDKQYYVYKCPFCKLRFTNEENDKDLKNLVIHCGSQHGFSVFYLMSDKHIEDTRKIVIEGLMTEAVKVDPEGKRVKTEPEIEIDVKEETGRLVKEEVEDYE